MDRFLLDNAVLYQTLVNQFKPAPPATQTAREPAEIPSPDMVVSARIRPLLDDDIASGFPCALFPRVSQPGVVDIHDLYHHPRGRPVLKSFNYRVDRLFGPDATSQEIYDSQVEDLVSFAWNGGIGTLFAYGQTGSGKTTTISGLEKLVVESLVDSGRPDGRKVYLSIIELAGNSAYDLLSSRKPISILEDSLGVTQMAGAEEHLLVQGRGEIAADLIERAASFRRTAPTLKNDTSSRSHSICRFRILGDEPDGTGDGLLYLVDLAGSEAARDIATHGAERMREAREINMSLSVLKDCIRGKAQADALASSSNPRSRQKRPPHVPFRQSALTKVLKHVFDPSASACKTKTVVIACVNPSLADVGPSKNTLRYAEMLRVSVPTALAASTQVSSGSSSSSNSSNSSNSKKVVSNSMAVMAPQLTTTRPSSRDPDPTVVSVPFQKRIRPGMVISHNPPPHDPSQNTVDVWDFMQLAVVLCPVDAMGGGGTANDAHGSPLRAQGSDSDSARYLCAQVTPGAISKTYEVNLWRQILVNVSRMEKEVVMEYDAETRYYHIAD